MTRKEFMDIVYSELHLDDDNYRANKIIDAADEYAKDNMDNIKREMVKEIIELRLRLLKQDIGSGNCPIAMYPLEIRLNIDCNEVSCRDCTNIWTKHKRKEIAKQVYKRYGLAESD